MLKKITLYFPYYNQQKALIFILNNILKYNKYIKDNISIFIVDDGSLISPALPIIKKYLNKLDITLWRINIDIKWNTPEANNLAFSKIKTDYVIRTDIDHFFNEINLSKLIYLVLSKKNNLNKYYYKFNRITTDNKIKNSHPNTYIISKKNYYKIKGYNESLSGNYGDDIDFLPRINKLIKPILLNIYIIVNHNFHTVGLNRNTSINKKKLKNKYLPHLIFRNKKYYILQI